MKRHHIGIAASIAVLIAILAYFLMSPEARAPLRDGEEPDDTSSAMRMGEYAVYTPDQKPGNSVVVSLVALAREGFVVIHDSKDDMPGVVLGTSLLLTAEGHQSITVPLIRTSVDGELFFARLYIDNGDGIFVPKDDRPAVDSFDSPITMPFRIDRNAEDAAPIAI